MEHKKRQFDIIIFGATSFTGKWLVHEVLKALDNGDKFSWAISGRSSTKMEELLQEISTESGKDLSKVTKIQADVFNPPTIAAMVKQCKVVLNLVGPYTEWGEPLVKACCKEGTHHLDLSAEPLFLGKMELKYSRMAEDSGAYIIGACGVGSIPSDYGATYLQQNFGGDVNSIESFLDIGSEDSTFSTIHYGTYYSAVLVMHHLFEFLPLRRELSNSVKLPKPAHQLPLRPIQFRYEVNGWALFAPFLDGDVMERTQRYTFQKDKQTPVQTRFYFQFPNIFVPIVLVIGAFFFALFAQFKYGVWLLARFPKLFSLGMCSHEGPTKEDMDKTIFTFKLVAKGWSDSADQHDEPPNKVKILKVRCINPAYGATVTMLLQAAVTLCNEMGRMPSKGGVYSPGAAFARTSLVDRLNRNGVTFTIQK